MNVKESLLSAGLNKSSAHIYESILSSGYISVTEIAKNTGIKRPTVYLHIEELLKKGLITKSIRGKRLYYLPENPNKILKEFDKRRSEIAKGMVTMHDLYTSSTHVPTVKHYEGLDGLIQAYLACSESHAPIFGFFSPDKLFTNIPQKYHEKFLSNIEQRGNVLKDLISNTKSGKAFVKDRLTYPEKHRKAKLLPKEYEVTLDLLITKDTVTMMLLDYPMAVVIESPDIAAFHRSIHTNLWKLIK